MKKLFIGIDFAKEKFDAAMIARLVSGNSATVSSALSPTTRKGTGSSSNGSGGMQGTQTESEWLFCGEDTGQCSHGLSKWLYGKGMDIWIESPYAIKHSSGIQRIKTDKADSSMIAEYGWRHQDKASLFKPLGKALEDLREVFLYRHKLVQQRVAMEIRDKGKESEETSKGLSFIRRKARHLIAELDRTIKECDLMIHVSSILTRNLRKTTA